jgi:hypothetical protein
MNFTKTGYGIWSFLALCFREARAAALKERAQMAESSKVEKFSMSELVNLRSELQVCRDDSWQVADVVSAFLAGRGYGANPETIRKTVSVIDAFNCSTNSLQEMDAMQAALESVAYVM